MYDHPAVLNGGAVNEVASQGLLTAMHPPVPSIPLVFAMVCTAAANADATEELCFAVMGLSAKFTIFDRELPRP
jgi:hypothetical protein